MLNFGFATPKRHILAQNRVFWRILCQCPWWRLGCRWLLYPVYMIQPVWQPVVSCKRGFRTQKIAEQTLVHEVAHSRKRNPLSDLNNILQDGRYPRHNHICKFWWRSVKGFRGGGGSKFALLHWLWSSPLQHSRITVRVCDAMPAAVTGNTLCSSDGNVLKTAPRDLLARCILFLDRRKSKRFVHQVFLE